MEIKLVRLLAAMEKLVEEYVERGVDSVTVDDIDEYWLVRSPGWSDFSKEPELSVGSLSDDVAGLDSVLEGEIPTAVDFDRLSSVLRAVSDKIVADH